MHLLAGLDSTGIEVLDQAAKTYSHQTFQKQQFSQMTHANIQEYRVMLMKPTVLPHGSGRAFQEMVRRWRIWSGQTTIFHEDSTLDPGTIRILSCEDLGDHVALNSILHDIGTGFRRVAMGKPKDSQEFAERMTTNLPLLMEGEHTHYIHLINP